MSFFKRAAKLSFTPALGREGRSSEHARTNYAEHSLLALRREFSGDGLGHRPLSAIVPVLDLDMKSRHYTEGLVQWRLLLPSFYINKRH